MKVATSCYGRYHIFDQAGQLARRGLLDRLVCDYPASAPTRWGVPRGRVVSLLRYGVAARVVRSIPRLPNTAKEAILQRLSVSFATTLANEVSSEMDAFIGISGLSLEMIQRARLCGVRAIVDHGSLHHKIENSLIVQDCEEIGIDWRQYIRPQWITERQQREFELADSVFVLSQVARHSLVDQGVAEQKIVVTPLGVDSNVFRPVPKLDKVFRVIYCGASTVGKGIRYLIRAFSDLNVPDSELYVIGSAPSPSLLKFIRGSVSLDNVKFLGTYPQSELHTWFSQGSVFVLPSLADGFGMVVAQAMACGLPVLVTENVGAAEIVTEGVDGFILPIRCADSIKERLLFLYENEAIRQEMGRVARQKAEYYTWDRYGNQLVASLTATEISCL